MKISIKSKIIIHSSYFFNNLYMYLLVYYNLFNIRYKFYYNYSYNIYDDKEAILSNSKLIVRGTVIDSEAKNINISS